MAEGISVATLLVKPMALKRKSGAAVRKWDGSPFRILSFDPGQTTGWASATYLGEGDIEYQSGQWGPDTHHALMWSNLNVIYRIYPNLEIVCESFEYRNLSRSGLVLVSKEYIGVINLFCELNDIVPTFNTATSAKHFVPDDKIKDLDLWLPGKPHAMDAMRHLLFHMVVGKGIRSPITDKWL